VSEEESAPVSEVPEDPEAPHVDAPAAWTSGPVLGCLIAIGALARLYLVFFTEDTLDVPIWETHAREVAAQGLAETYRNGTYTFNHPPPIGVALGWLHTLCAATGLSFAIALRLPIALADAGSAWLLRRVLARDARPAVAEAATKLALLYWLCPLAWILSAYHGNTDAALAPILLGALLCVLRQDGRGAGALLGLGLWIKLPIVIAAPALFFGLVGMRARVHCLVAFGLVAVAGYGPSLIGDAEALVRSVLLYGGLQLQTTAGEAVWGWQQWVPAPRNVPIGVRELYRGVMGALLLNNTLITLGPVLLLALLRAKRREPGAIAVTIVGSYTIFYGFTNSWAFQYLAWALPLWWLAGARFALPAVAVSTLYVFGLYAWLTGSIFLHGPWAFVAKPVWPLWIRLARDAAVLFFFAAAWAWIGLAIRDAWRDWHATDSSR